MRQTTNPDFFKQGTTVELPWSANRISRKSIEEIEKPKEPLAVINENPFKKDVPNPL